MQSIRPSPPGSSPHLTLPSPLAPLSPLCPSHTRCMWTLQGAQSNLLFPGLQLSGHPPHPTQRTILSRSLEAGAAAAKDTLLEASKLGGGLCSSPCQIPLPRAAPGPSWGSSELAGRKWVGRQAEKGVCAKTRRNQRQVVGEPRPSHRAGAILGGGSPCLAAPVQGILRAGAAQGTGMSRSCHPAASLPAR